jgi:alpha-amylase
MKLHALALSLAFVTSHAFAAAPRPFVWENATVYFLLTDRFHNGDKSNDLAYGRKADAATLRGYMGGDFKGITQKIRAGYFRDLGIDVLWFTPPVEQIHAGTDEGTGKSYGFHGYWAKDFTAVDANLGTEKDLRELVDTAHKHGIRVLLDVVMNHTGPVTEADPAWPADWVRTEPTCTYKDSATTMACTLVRNLPDFRTESDAPVALPAFLAEKWKKEGRYEREVKELDEFFARTGYPRAPRYYLMKWHADWVRKYGFDGFRADTAKHVEAGVWKDLKQVASAAYEDWKKANPRKKLGDDKFYMTAETYNYAIAHGPAFDLGDIKVNYFANGFDSMINFSMKSDAKASYEELFSSYSKYAQTPQHAVLNYMSSHDDGSPFDQLRERPLETATKLLLAPGAAQIYYGDELARPLKVQGAEGDANLRSFMNWEDLGRNAAIRKHWSRLGLFRKAHVAVGAGVHTKLADQPYTFQRVHPRDKVVVALDVARAGTPINVGSVFKDGERVRDAYSGEMATVAGGKVVFKANKDVVLIEKK